MNSRKTAVRIFTIADFEEEEVWLRDQHKKGWKLVKMIPPCFFIFEQCMPEDVVYRLDYQNNAETGDYFQIFKDYGWEYVSRCVGWLYFRKPSSKMNFEQDGELFSDNESKIDLINHVVKTRLLPILLIFLCCVLPNFFKTMLDKDPDPLAAALTVFFSVMLLIYLYLLIYCGIKLRKLSEKYRND